MADHTGISGPHPPTNFNINKVKSTKQSKVIIAFLGLLLCATLAAVVLLGILVGKVSRIISMFDNGHGEATVEAIIVNDQLNWDPIHVVVVKDESNLV